LQTCTIGREERSTSARELNQLIASSDDAINVFDLEAVARNNLPPAHFGYMATGVDDDATLRANREGYSRLFVRPRRLVDVTNIDMSVELFGERWESPIVISPCGSQRAFHPQGELAVASAARTRNHLQILSTVTTTSVEDVTEARGAPVWYQLYPTSNWTVTQALLRRAEAAGSPVVVLTVDMPGGGNRETVERYARIDSRDCSACHDGTFEGDMRRKPMFDGLDLSNVTGLSAPGLTWDFVRRLKDNTDMRVVVKGIVTHGDAARCVQYGADGIIVSNHGGRAEESGRATIESLPEVVEAVGGRIPVLVDGGIRRGNDVLKALALGADAICIGRPYLWGLAAFGQQGVERVLDLLRAELQMAMRMAGAASVGDIEKSLVARA
jgi:isopentenyl diphosphate isomerase/L-lactate dehydrogenase-like FMN-dependent dehydrogenase